MKAAAAVSAAVLSLAVVAPLAAWTAPLSKNELTILRERDTRYPSAPPSEFAMLLAGKIGREGNVDGLRAIVALRDVSLLQRAVASYRPDAPRQLPEPLEALIVEHYADAQLRRPLLGLVANNVDKDGRFPKYRSRKLFDLLYAELKGGEQFSNAICIVATELKGVEPELLARLPELGPAAANEIVSFLGLRRFAAAAPALVALQAKTPYERNENQLLQHINQALLQIGTPESLQAVLARMKALGSPGADRRPADELWGILLNVADLPAGSPPDYADLRAALPANLNESSWGVLVKIIAARKEKRGIPELIRALTQAPRNDDAVNTLLALGDPPDWRSARAELERKDAGIAPERLAALQKRLDDAIADPPKWLARRQQMEREQALQQDVQKFREEKARLAPSRRAEPQRYAAGMAALIQRRAAQLREYADLPASTGARIDLMREYTSLAAFLRFTLKKPDDAIAAYQAAARLQPERGIFDATSLAIADVQRFDRRDPGKAVESYRAFLAVMGEVSARPEARGFPLAGLRRWIEREIDYLERGRAFSGVVGREDLSVLQPLMMVAAMHQEMDFASQDTGMRQALEALPASQLHIGATFTPVLQLPSADILRFFAKHDPAGYLTAVLLALASQPAAAGEGRGNPFGSYGGAGAPGARAAAETFFRTRGIRSALGADPRFATAEKTWGSFIESAKNGNAQAMLACFTAGMREKLQGLFGRMSREELRGMAESFVAFSLQEATGGYREALIVRQSGEKKQAGFVHFVNQGGEWKIESM